MRILFSGKSQNHRTTLEEPEQVVAQECRKACSGPGMQALFSLLVLEDRAVTHEPPSR